MDFIHSGTGNVADYETIEINSVNELSVENAIYYRDSGYGSRYIQIKEQNYPNIKENKGRPVKFYQEEKYDINTYIAIRQKLNELVEGIDPSWNELTKYAMVYDRVCKSISYDYVVADPKSKQEKNYSEANVTNCRNLKNGILYGKCVCAGYADILRTALSLVGVESCYVQGRVRTFQKMKDGFSLDEYWDNLINPENEYHAWVKVKINDKWYNADPTYDSAPMRNGHAPRYFMMSDMEMQKLDRSENFGPKCIDEVPKKMINRLFGRNDTFIGNTNVSYAMNSVRWKLHQIKEGLSKEFHNIKENLFENLGIKRLPEGQPQNQINNFAKPIVRRNSPIVESWKIENWESDENMNYNQYAPNNNINQKNKNNEEKDFDER